MTRRTAASLTPTASIPPLSPEDRVSNFSVPPSSAGGDYDGGHALLEWALPVEVVDADARFAEWFFEVSKYLRQGHFAAKAADDVAGTSGNVQGERKTKTLLGRDQPVATQRTSEAKPKKRKESPATAKKESSAVKRKQPAGSVKAKKTAATKSARLPCPAKVALQRTRVYYARNAKAAGDPGRAP